MTLLLQVLGVWFGLSLVAGWVFSRWFRYLRDG